jgi:hypothetical protein
MTGIAWVAVPLSLMWLFNAVWLGWKQKALEARQGAESG